jgi:hypothetical protein
MTGVPASPSSQSGFAPSPDGLGHSATVPNADRTALSYWFPKVLAAGLPVPKTNIIQMSDDAHRTIAVHLWGEDADPSPVAAFVETLKATAAGFGLPFFLRTDHTSGKHDWDRACFVADPNELTTHVYTIAEYSELAGLIGMPWRKWVVREMLPTKPVGFCPVYRNMPVCKEFRFFVDGEKIECFHPYWPRHALRQGGCELSSEEYAELCDPGDVGELSRIASRAGGAVGGRWSVDLLETERGWFLTDMAEADKSFHWDGCPAQAGEAGTAETAETDSVHEHAVPKGCAHPKSKVDARRQES